MISKNAKKLTLNLEKLFEEFNEFVMPVEEKSTFDLDASRNEIENLSKQISSLENELSAFIKQNQISFANLNDSVKSELVFIDEITLKDLNHDSFVSKLKQNVSLRIKALNFVNEYNSNYQKYSALSSLNVKTKKEEKELEELINYLSKNNSKIKSVVLNIKKSHDLSLSNNQVLEVERKEVENLKTVISKKQEIENIKNSIQALVKEIEENENKEIVEDKTPSFEDFELFLKAKKLSTSYAKEYFEIYMKNGNHNSAKIKKNNFKIRKTSKVVPVIKKVVVPMAITAGGIAIASNVIMNSGLPGGTIIAGVIPVSGTPGLTETATATVGVLTGLAATPLYYKSKKLVVKTYYKLRNKNKLAGSRIDNNIDAYENGTSFENIPSSKLIKKIQEKQEEIHTSIQPIKYAQTKINRNRIHEIQSYAIELAKRYHEIDSSNLKFSEKAENLQPIYEMLLNIQNFISNDVQTSINKAKLTCNDKKKTADHKFLIENLDIYADLKIYTDRIAKTNGKNNKDLMKDAKRTIKNTDQKKEEAYKILNGKRFITDTFDFERKYGKISHNRKETISESDLDNKFLEDEISIFG